jgi:hypothetical protein
VLDSLDLEPDSPANDGDNVRCDVGLVDCTFGILNR